MENETIGSRFAIAQSNLSSIQIAVVLAFSAAIVFTLMFLQEPLVHESVHNFRHAAGITCH
ncbi:cobalamin cluster protein [Halobacteriales archaeon QS_6_64_34]|nr:MAG: cobalamin cluster protein [Halobacteriales archaeon QS_6_64_34]